MMELQAVFALLGILSGMLLIRAFRKRGSHSEGGLQGTSYGNRPITVIIPARNEEMNLPRLLDSLRRQSRQPEEIIVVDDGSVDRTAELASRMGAKVLRPGELPAGWRGKCWACWNGANAAKGDILVFLDADTCMEEEGLQLLMTEFLTSPVPGIMTVQPYHNMVKPYEQLSAFFNLIVVMAVGAGNAQFLNMQKDGRRQQGGFGPCLIIAKDQYVRVGGHRAICGFLLEHHELCRRASSLGLSVRNMLGASAVTFRMYPEGLKALTNGWAKGFAAGAANTSIFRLMGAVLWITGAVTNVSMLMSHIGAGWSLEAGIAAALYLVYAILLTGWLGRIGGFKPLTAWLYPIPLAFYLLLFVYSWISIYLLRKVSWKGRSIRIGSGDSS
ncbi:glycosyltransferase family 2 protein [Paenibacillus sp. strain BS8-2]